VPPLSASATAPTTVPTAAPAPPADPDERLLLTAPLAAISPVHRTLAPHGLFDAVLAPPEGRRQAQLSLAVTAEPLAYRRPLAFYRLARALGARVVPAAALRHLDLATLGAAAGTSPDARTALQEARVLNDGTVDVLLTALAPPHAGSPWEPPTARTVDPEHGREPATWDVWAASVEPARGEDTALLRDYVEMLVLDYLAANGARRAVLVAGSALVLADNGSAFPWRPEASSVDRLLRRLRTVERFPRGLRDALLAFDRDRAAATFAEGSFETWLLAPRVRVELDERRAALLTLIEAKIAARGAEAVLRL
jgi:hypothetical protein